MSANAVPEHKNLTHSTGNRNNTGKEMELWQKLPEQS
jgi:hypothetical protein